MNTSKVLFFLFSIFTLLIFLNSSLSAEIIEPIIDGDYVYIDDSKAYLKGTYSATHGQDIEHWAMTKQFTGDCDMAIGFDGRVAWPTKVLLDDPHYEYSETNTSHTFYYVTNFAPTTDTPDYGNWYNSFKYKFDHKTHIGYDNATNESIWQDVIGTVAFFDSQTNDGTNYTITWHTEHSQLEQYRDISNRILANPINYEFDGKNLWFVTKDIPMTAGAMQKIVIEMDGKIELGEQSYKYDIIWKPSHQTIAEAKAAGNLYVLDPYWNISWEMYETHTFNTLTPKPFFQVHITNVSQTLFNLSDSNGNTTRVTSLNHSTVYPIWIEHWTTYDNISLWVNVSYNQSTGVNIFGGTPSANSVSDGDATFLFFDDFPGSSLDTNKWTPTGTITVANSIATIGTGSEKIVSVDSFSTAITEFRIKWVQGTGDPRSGFSNAAMSRRCYAAQYLHYFYLRDASGTNFVSTNNWLDNIWETIIISRDISVPKAWWYENDVEATNSPSTTNVPTENINLYFSTTETAVTYLDWVFVRMYTTNQPTVIDISEPHFYADSLHYNAIIWYNFTIESDGTLTSNRSIIQGDDINDTAQSTGTTNLIITNFDNVASIVRNFTITGDDLDWYQAENITGTYNMKNSSGTLQTVADGNFTINLVAGDYWIEQAGISIVLLSQTPSIIYTNSTGYLNISYGITHSSSGLNNTSVSFIYRNYDWDLSDSNHSIRPPSNNLASVWNFNGRILRAANRNETPGLNFENNAAITGGDTYTWSGLDENSTKLTIVPVNSTYTKVYINATVHCIMPQMWYLDRTDQQEAIKLQLPIHKTQNVLIKFWNLEIFKGNYDFLGVGYTDTSLSSNPALWPTDANPVYFYYINSSYDPATGGDPITSDYAVYMGSLNASGWVDHVYSRSDSNYVRGFIDNNYLHTVINTTNISYLYFTSNTESSKPYYINMTNVASSTNVSFANTNTLWAGSSYPLSSQLYTPNIWFAFMKLNMSLDHRLWAADNNDLWGVSSMNRTNITQALFPPTRPTIDHFHFPTPNDTDYDMDGVYYGNFSIGCGVSTDPDGGDVTHNLTLHYADNLTLVTIINNTFTDKDITHNGVYFDANFSSIPYYSQTDNYTLRLIATDDESESVTVWLGVNFSLDGSPQIISYSPETPVSSVEGENQTFSITTNLPGNVTWYIDLVEVFNETDVNSSSYSNSTALAGVYNVTVVTTNTNGSNSMTWDWTVKPSPHNPLLFKFYVILVGFALLMTGYTFLVNDINNYTNIITGYLSGILYFIAGYYAYIGIGIDKVHETATFSSGVITSTVSTVTVTAYQYDWLGLLFIVIGVIMILYSVVQSIGAVQYIIAAMESSKS